MQTVSVKMSKKSSASKDDQRWQAVQQRDASVDGKFVYAVSTTGVYCRPVCPSRLALRKNIAFFANSVEAKNAGYRPCKRCKPDDQAADSSNVSAIQSACRSIEAADAKVSLDELAASAKMSPSHFHRTFRSILGITPKQYEIQVRRDRARSSLEDTRSITDAIYSSGHGSSSRFYEQSNQWLGMKPSVYRSGAKSERIQYASRKSSLGTVLVAISEKGVCAILLGKNKSKLVQELQETFPEADIAASDKPVEQALQQVISLVEEPKAKHSIALDIRGTAFQQQVWQALQKIPGGQTYTYQELAAKIGHPKSARAVANACAANKLAVAIPCHRIVRNDGTLSGYRWSTELKRELLQREERRT